MTVSILILQQLAMYHTLMTIQHSRLFQMERVNSQSILQPLTLIHTL
jgi:hypothetical protein